MAFRHPAILASLLLAACGYTPQLAGSDAGEADAPVAVTSTLEVTGASGSFGDVVVGRASAAAILVIHNRGDADTGRLAASATGDFSLTEDGCGGSILPPGGSCTISVAFSPTLAGERTGRVVAEATPGGSASAPLTGRGLAPCELLFDFGEHDFGAVAVTTASAVKTFVLSNDGQAISEPLAVSLPAGAAFSIAADTCSGVMLAGGSTCSITARFLPTSVGSAAGSLTAGAPGGCVTATSLGGTGTARVSIARTGAGDGAITSSPAGIDCGAACAHDFADANVTLSAAAPAGHTFVGWGGGCAAAGTGSCTLALGGAVAATATFEPHKILTIGRTGTGDGAVTSTPSGINCGATCTAAFAHGASVTLAATPAAGSSFAGWTGACSGTGACVVAMDAARGVAATFERLVQPLAVTVIGSGSVGSSPVGIACPTDCAHDFAHGTPVTLSPTPATGWVFNGWSGACAGTGACQIAMTDARSVTATFVLTTPSLAVTRVGTGSGTVTSSPSGITCGATCMHAFVFGTLVALTPAAAAGSSFAGWSGACSGTGACVVTVDAARTVDAIFDRNRHPLAVGLSGTGIGTVTSSPGGITCGAACAASFDEGTLVTLTAAPGVDSQFAGWSGACSGSASCVVTMSAARSVTATFDATKHTLTVMRTGAGSGTVTANLTGISCGTDCSEPFPIGTVVTLTATPDATSDFGSWGGACSGMSTCQVTMDQAKTVTADFVLEQNTLSVSRSGDGSGTITSSSAGISCGTDCSEIYAGNQSVSLTATAASGSSFISWSGCTTVTANDKCFVDMSQAHSVTATFQLPHTLSVIKNGSGAGSVTSDVGGINCGTTCSRSITGPVTLTATPAAGSGFVKWTGCTSSNGTSCTAKLTADTVVTATFGTLRTVTITKTGSGVGSVGSFPSGLSCSSGCATASASFAEGLSINLSASGFSGSAFAGWGGACTGLASSCTLVIDANKSVTAAFEPTRTLTLTKAGNGSGTITSNPTGISCGSTCTAGFASGSMVTLTAAATTGSHFVSWSSPCIGTSPCTVTMDVSKTVTATFASP